MLKKLQKDNLERTLNDLSLIKKTINNPVIDFNRNDNGFRITQTDNNLYEIETGYMRMLNIDDYSKGRISECISDMLGILKVLIDSSITEHTDKLNNL